MKKIFSTLSLVAMAALIAGCTHDSTGNYQYKTAGNYSRAAHDVKHLHNTVYFAFDSSVLSESAKEALLVQVEHMKRHPNDSFKVEGHADERGTREYNFGLGERRANAVKEFLVHHGINSEKLVVISYGKDRPAVFGSGEDVWAKNRRAFIAHM